MLASLLAFAPALQAELRPALHRLEIEPIVVLQVMVLDENGNPIEGADVALYATEDDADEEANGLKAPKPTNKSGKVTWRKGLEPKSYYVVAKKGIYRTKEGLRTETLSKNNLNKLNVILYKQD